MKGLGLNPKSYDPGVELASSQHNHLLDQDPVAVVKNPALRPIGAQEQGRSVPPLTSVARLVLARADAITGPPLEPAPQKQLKSPKKTQNTPGAGQKEVEPDTPPL
jgi:hypothetical protein